MANKVKMQIQEGIAWPAIFAAVLNKDDLVRVTADETVNAAADTHVVKGYVVKSATAANGRGTVMLKGRAVIEILFSGNLAAGTEVKMAALSGSNQQVAAFVAGTDAEALRVGWVLKGANNAVGLVVLY
ncbi:MAG: hypothetical protein AB7U82_33635 [Blastocatellales bacterium]